MTTTSVHSAGEDAIGRRLLVTAGALAIFAIGRRVPLPGLDTSAAATFGAQQSLGSEFFSIFALGVTPILSALLILEVVKLVFPSVRAWQAAAASNATIMQRVALALSLAIAAFQAWGVSGGLALIPGLATDAAFTPVAVATLVAATAVLAWLAQYVSQCGFGQGFWIIYVAPGLAAGVKLVALTPEFLREGMISPPKIAGVLLFGLVCVAALTFASARLRAREGDQTADAIIWPPLLASYVSMLLIYAPKLAFGLDWLAVNGAFHMALLAVLILILTFMRETPTLRDDARNGLDPGVLMAFVQIAVCVGAMLLTQALALPAPLSGIALIVVVATFHDLVASIREANEGLR